MELSQPGDDSANENIHLSSTQPTSPRSPLIEEQLFHDSPDQPIHTEEPILHLVPRTWNEFLELDQPLSGYYDYVEGLVVWCPHMANANHNNLGTYVPTALECSQRVTVFYTPSIQVFSERGKIEWTANQDPCSSSQADGSSSSSEQNQLRYGLYHPDFAITKARRVSDASSTTSRDRAAQEKIQFALPYTETLLALVEITSKSTRQVDFGPKWRAFARSGLPLYVILDRGPSGKHPKQVIVGMRDRVSKDDERSLSADKHDPPKNKTEEKDSFYRKVYKLKDKVDCPYFSKLDMTAAQLLDEKWMKRAAIRMENDRRNQRSLAAEEKSKREKAERERDQEKSKRERTEQERDQAERERDQEKSKRDQAERERDQEKSKRERTEQERDRLLQELEDIKQNRKKDDAETSGRKEGKKKNTDIEDKKTQRTRKASEVKRGSSSESSPKTTSPTRKKVRK